MRESKDTHFELHISTSAGFTPSAATLFAAGNGRSFEVGNLDPSKTHYAQIVPITWQAGRPVRGQPSAEISFTPGRAAATQLNPNVNWGRLPLNGGFETQFDPAVAPDFWFNGSGTEGVWGTNCILLTDASGVSGASYLKLITSGTTVAGLLYSAAFSINEKKHALVRCWRKTKAGGANNAQVLVMWLDKDQAVLSFTGTSFLLNDQVDVWVEQVSDPVLPPANARFARVVAQVAAGAAGRECHFDDFRFEEAASHVRASTATAGNYVTLDVIKYATEEYDSLGEYLTGTTWAFTATQPGYYHASAAIMTDTQAWALGNTAQVLLQKNGTTVAFGSRPFAPAAANWYLTSAVVTSLKLVAGDVLRCIISHDRAAGNVTLYTDANANYFTVDRIP